MTVFDNIKVNNWPSSTTDPFEDFCVLKLPLNDQASLTESLPVVVGAKELFPKRTLTNVGVSIEQPLSVVNVKLHTFIHGTPGTFKVNGTTVPRGNAANGDVTFTVAVNGGLSSIAWSYDSGNGPYCYMRGIEVDLGDGNGYQLIQDGSFGVSAYSSLVSGTVDSNYPLSNLFGGTIGTGYTNGTRHTNPGTLTLNLSSVFTPTKHYDNNAKFNASVLTTTAPVPRGGTPRTLEFWAYLNSGANSWQNIISYGSSSDSKCFGINRGNSDTSNIAFTGFSGGDWNTGTSVASYLNTWTHFSVSYDSGTVEIFLNGTSIGTASRTLDTGGSTFVVGGSEHSGNNERFSGKIQDVRVYNKKIRTANFTPPGAILG